MCGFYIFLKEMQIAGSPACSSYVPEIVQAHTFQKMGSRGCNGSSRMTWLSEQNWELEGCVYVGGGSGMAVEEGHAHHDPAC